jgi:uncharacterized protein (DUF362 family)
VASTIYVEKTDRRREFTSAVLERFTRDLLVRNPRNVLVKPNISSYEPYPTTTHPDVLDAVLRFLKRFHVHIYVGDGPAVDAGNSTELLQTHPLRSTCSAHNLDLLNLHSHGFTRVKTERGYTLNVSAVALDCDYIISLPVLQPHPRCGISGALNNQFGLFPLRDRLLMRSRFLKDIHRSIAEVNTVARPNIIIMDAVKTYINANELRHGAQPTDLGYMLGGGDPVALDCYGLKLMSAVEPALADKKPDDIDHLAWAIRVGAGKSDYIVHQAVLR